MDINMQELDSEELYQTIKNKIKKQKEMQNSEIYKNTILQDYTYTQEEIYCAKKFISFDVNNLNKWVSTNFESNLNEKNILSPEITGKWGTAVKSQRRTSIDISNLIYLSNEDINYKIVNNTLKSTFILKGESEFWIFLHSKGNFNDETIVILFSKIEFSETVFMPLGLFVKSNNNNNIYDDNENNNEYTFRVLKTIELVRSYNINENKYNKYESSDSCMIKIVVIDEGNENIKVSAWINDGDAENKLFGNFYKQVIVKNYDNIGVKASSTFEFDNKCYKIMIAGSGQQCKITQFCCETNFKDNLDYIDGCKQGFNSCNCCFII